MLFKTTFFLASMLSSTLFYCQNIPLDKVTNIEKDTVYSKIDVGFTERGLQIWCQRHQLNICHINFDGKKLETDFRCLEKKR